MCPLLPGSLACGSTARQQQREPVSWDSSLLEWRWIGVCRRTSRQKDVVGAGCLMSRAAANLVLARLTKQMPFWVSVRVVEPSDRQRSCITNAICVICGASHKAQRQSDKHRLSPSTEVPQRIFAFLAHVCTFRAHATPSPLLFYSGVQWLNSVMVLTQNVTATVCIDCSFIGYR